jgi:hypothetical protein
MKRTGAEIYLLLPLEIHNLLTGTHQVQERSIPCAVTGCGGKILSVIY